MRKGTTGWATGCTERQNCEVLMDMGFVFSPSMRFDYSTDYLGGLWKVMLSPTFQNEENEETKCIGTEP